MSAAEDELAADAVTLQVVLADAPDGPANRVVIYDWFTRKGTPPRGGNVARVLVDGEVAWDQVYTDLLAAQHEVHVATWMLRPDIELRRPDSLTLEPREARKGLRFGDVVEQLAGRGVNLRLLIWGMTYTPILNRWLRKWYWQGPDQVQLLEQDHPLLIGSHHQKTITIDRRVGFCGGMNLKENDWDVTDHAVFDARRTPHRVKLAKRRAILGRAAASAFPPRHDLMVRMEGPVVQDLYTNFQERWNASVRARRASLLGRLTDLVRRRAFGRKPYTSVPLRPSEVPDVGAHWVQVVRTMPDGEDGILDAYIRAIGNARKYIYIENQYFRSQYIAEAIKRAIERTPDLRVAVVVWPINDGKQSYFNPMGHWTAYTQDHIRKVRPDFHLTRVMSFDHGADGAAAYSQIDVHAKVMLIDDAWITVGSANINDRGFKYEGEINVVLLDDGLARDLRLRLMAEHLRVPLEQAEETLGDYRVAFDLWAEHCEKNKEARAAGAPPVSHVHPFIQRGVRWTIGVGSGVF